MKNILPLLILSTTIAYGASESKSGPLLVGNFAPDVSNAATNKIKHSLQMATNINLFMPPSGSVTAMWSDVANKSVSPYFEEHPGQLAASSVYVARANSSSTVELLYNQILNHMHAPISTRTLLWKTFTLAASSAYAELEKQTIPELNLNIPTVVGIMLMNQKLTFSPEETLSFGGAIGAEISIMNLIYKKDTAAFKAMFKRYLPEASVTD